MAERKVLNKYRPPDFDPAKIPRRRMPKNKQIKIRTMLSMSIRCNSCGNYIYKGTKLNSRKEDVIGETYLGIQKVRFGFKCTNCSASNITIKTDPQNSDYTVESGAKRNFEPWRADVGEQEQRKRNRDAEEMGDSMKSLENRTFDSKRELDIQSAIEEIKSINSRRARVSFDTMLEALHRSAPVQQLDKLEEEDEALTKSLFQRSRELVIRRIDDDDDDDDIDRSGSDNGESSQKISFKKRKVSQKVADSPKNCLTKKSANDVINGSIILKSSTVKLSVVKKPSKAKTQATAKEDNLKITNDGLQSLCQQYQDSDEEDEY